MATHLLSLLFGMPVLVMMAAVVVVIVLVSLRYGRSTTRPQPGLPSGGPINPAAVAGQWNVHLRREGHLDPLSGFGTLTLADEMLTFQAEDGETPGWSHPVRSFGVWSNVAIANSDVTIGSAATGKLGMTVSHQHINRLSRNTLKLLRERDAAREFAQGMRAAGATILA